MMVRPVVHLALFLLFVTPLPAQTFDVGEHGAKLTLQGSWRRSELVAGIGKNQFLADSGVRIVIIEIQTAFEGDHSVLETLATFHRDFTASTDLEASPLGEATLLRWKRASAATKDYKVRESGLDLRYRVLVVNKHHLKYFCTIFALEKKSKEVERASEMLRAGLRFPPTDSEWRKKILPSTHELSTPWGVVRADYSDHLWTPDSAAENALLAVEASDDVTGFFLFEMENNDVEDAMENVQAHHGELYEAYSEYSRANRTVSGIEGLEVVGVGEGGKRTVASLVLPVSKERCLELRLDCPHGEPFSRSLWNQWIPRIRIDRFEPGEAFPEPTAAEPSVVGEAPPEVAAWLSMSEWLGTASGIRLEGAIASDDGFFVYGRGGVQKVASAGAETWIYRDSETTLQSGRVCLGGDDVLIRFGSLLYDLDEEGDWHESPHGAYAQARLGEQLLVVRRPARGELRGFSQLPIQGPEQLLSVSSSGEEIVLREDRDWFTTWLTPSGSGDAVFVARRPRRFDGTSLSRESLPCLVRARNGAETSCGDWHVLHVAPGKSGWVVTGKPREAITGIYWVRNQAEPELLISGTEFVGVGIDAEHLICAGPPYLPAKGPASGTALYRVPLSTLREKGRATNPFDAEVINRIGDRAVAMTEHGLSAVFRTAASVRKFVGDCDGVAREHHGRPLPRGPAELDRAFGFWIGHGRSFERQGLAVLAALLSITFLEGGAEWVPGDVPAHGFTPRVRRPRSNCYVYTRVPTTAVHETLFDQEGYYRPVSEIIDELEGRKLLIGMDVDALDGRLAEYAEDHLWQLLRDEDPAPLFRHLQEHRDNIYLRYEVYEKLAALARTHDLKNASDPFLDGDAPLFIDVRANLSGQLAATEDRDLTAIIHLARGAIGRFSRAPALYLLLGDAYVARDADSDERLARQCYEKVVELTQKGDHADHAREALDGLSKEK